MIPEVLDKIFKTWERLSQREQMLAIATAAALVIFGVFLVWQRTQARLDELDSKIGRLEDELVTNTLTLQHREVIEQEYAAIAAQHSSAWTEAEIHDRLRQEIYRLAQNTPAALDKNGIPIPGTPNIGNLVEIPSMGKGQMAEGGTGYREYRINLRIPPTELRNIIQFLERLHNSPQSLRIDALDLNRSPEQELVAASIDISRIVADGASLTVPDTSAALPGGLGRVNLNADAWKAENASVQNAPSQSIHGEVAIQMMAGSAEVYMLHSLPGGADYEMIANISSSSPDVMVGVGKGEDGTPFGPMQPVAGDGQVNRYQIPFSLPEGSAPVALQSPLIQSTSTTGAIVQVTGLLLQAASEVYQ
jgi:hypothetical protein